MSFELKPQKSLRKNFRRIVRQQLDDALEELTGERKEPRDEAVHEGRKRFKRVRALLRLVRPAVGEKIYRSENVCFRDAGRPLTEVRDAKIFIETLDGLVEHFKEHIAGRAFSNVRQALQDNLPAVRRRVLDEQNAFTVTAEMVRKARERVTDWVSVPNRWSAVGRGLEDTYRRARMSLEAAVAQATVENLHEWRKQVKYLRYQLEVLVSFWRERLQELVNETDRMGDLLGDEHDLAALRHLLTDDPDRFGDRSDQEVLLALIDRRRTELEEEALLLGKRFFRDRASGFARRLKEYWKIWRAEFSTARS